MKRETLQKQLLATYQERKKKYPVEIPKYIKYTKLDLDQQTYRNITVVKKIISDKEMNDFFNNE